jgi:hypothetical protein
MSDETNGGFEAVTPDELEAFKKLQKKVKAAKKQSKEMTNGLLQPIMENADIDGIFNAIALTGGERISLTTRLPDGRKLNLCFRDMTNVGKKDDED